MTDIQKENKSGGKVPNLRFPGFEDAWEVKKLGEVATNFMYGMNTAATVYDGENQYIRITDIDERTRLFTPNPLSSPDGELEDKYLLEKGDILFARTGASVGKSYLYSEKDGKIFFAGFLIRLNVKTENPYFIFSQTLTEKYQKWVLTMSMRSGQPGINAEEYKLLPIALPSFEEQSKIAFFLSKIDERIQTQSKIIEGLKKLKVATAKKIFSQEFRFKDDKGNDFSEWEEILLGEVMSIPEKTKAQNIDKNKLLTVKLHLKGVLKNDNTDTLSFGATNYFIRKKGQFIYGKQNLFNGAFDIIPDEFDGFLSSGDVPTLEINNSKINSSFLLYLMGRKEFYKPLEDFATGSGSKRIHEKTLLGIKIPFPSLPEQTKIVNFLSAIDSKIDMETQLLQKLEEQKKFLLQNMFV